MAEKNLGDRDFVAVHATRYAIGRVPLAVRDTVDWLLLVWPDLDGLARDVIRADIEEAFALDDKLRAKPEKWALPLGNDAARAQWERLRKTWRNDET